jgi:hypothetical protein
MDILDRERNHVRGGSIVLRRPPGEADVRIMGRVPRPVKERLAARAFQLGISARVEPLALGGDS